MPVPYKQLLCDTFYDFFIAILMYQIFSLAKQQEFCKTNPIFICCTLRSWVHQIVLLFRTFPPAIWGWLYIEM